MQNPSIRAEAELGDQLAALLHQVETLYRGLADTDTLLRDVAALDNIVDRLYATVIETGELPLNAATLSERVRAQAPAELVHLIDNTTVFGGVAS
ncbi:hypothetical protein ACIBJI_40150 [Nocardia sp. NPDC050408]|uniref:hypothetical protein n=1 Tax=Nocardia sp. NPDC050408 TaxID=3364319 RepID=UPI00379EF566